MPIYEYQCAACNNLFEALVPAGTKVACPSCGSKKVTKQFSTFAAHQGSNGSTPCASGTCPGSAQAGSCAGGQCPFSG